MENLPLTILLEGFNLEKEKVLALLTAKYQKLQNAYAQDLESLTPWQIKNLHREEEELNLLLGFLKQLENILGSYSPENQKAREEAQYWQNALKTHNLSDRYKSIMKQVKQLKKV